MKIAILTLNGHYNYGNRLQNYALQEVLKKNGAEVETIWLEDEIFEPQFYFQYNIKNIIQYFINWKNFRKKNSYGYKYRTVIAGKNINIKKFSDKYININYDVRTLREIEKKYDYFVVGSDQVWNPNLWTKKQAEEKVYLLDFSPKRKCIAYAASIGMDELPVEYRDDFKRSLCEMGSISVREDAAALLLRDILGVEPQVVLDPTFLISKEEWRRKEERPDWYKKDEKFVLAYFLGNKPQGLNEKVIKMGYKLYDLMDLNDFNLFTSGVGEFLWLIDNAELVLTDSFHACVFSIIFEKSFLVARRKREKEVDMSSRLATLDRWFGIRERIVDLHGSNIELQDYVGKSIGNKEQIINDEKVRSEEFLEKAIIQKMLKDS